MKATGIARLRIVVAWIIVVAWVGSLVLDATAPEYAVPASVHGLMLIVAGYLFGPTITGRNGNHKERGPDDQ